MILYYVNSVKGRYQNLTNAPRTKKLTKSHAGLDYSKKLLTNSMSIRKGPITNILKIAVVLICCKAQKIMLFC